MGKEARAGERPQTLTDLLPDWVGYGALYGIRWFIVRFNSVREFALCVLRVLRVLCVCVCCVCVCVCVCVSECAHMCVCVCACICGWLMSAYLQQPLLPNPHTSTSVIPVMLAVGAILVLFYNSLR